MTDSRVRHKPLTALENKNLIPTVKFGKLSVMVWGCISSKGVGVIRILDEIMTKDVYPDILQNEQIVSINKIDPVNSNKFYYNYYQDNDPKHKSYLCKSWLLYNCTKVINTPVLITGKNTVRIWHPEAYLVHEKASASGNYCSRWTHKTLPLNWVIFQLLGKNHS